MTGSSLRRWMGAAVAALLLGAAVPARADFLNGVVFYPTENLVSEERMFRVGQLHYTNTIPLDKIPVYQAMENTPYVQAPYLGTYFYLINTERPPVDDVRVRKAVSMAIDRHKLNDTVLQKSNVPAYSITPPGGTPSRALGDKKSLGPAGISKNMASRPL